MKKQHAWLWLFAVFALVFALHAGYTVWNAQRIAQRWVKVGTATPFSLYWKNQEFLVGLSFALAAAFTVYAFLRFRERRTVGKAGLWGGATMATVLYFGGCWLVGCCGSPLLPVYLSLFGSWFLGFTKPLMLGATVASVGVGVWWMERKMKQGAGCGCDDSNCKTDMKSAPAEKPLDKIQAELAEGMTLSKCRQCGCMKDALAQLGAVLPTLGAGATELARKIAGWQPQMQPIKYACLGCEYCYPAVGMNALHTTFPESEKSASLGCEFEARPNVWPPVAGEYFEFCDGDGCPVAVSTLASPELSDALAQRRPRGLCIVGKTETENIGIDKLIKNTVTNRTIRYLVLAGHEPQGHETGRTLLALAANGVDDSMRVIGSTAKRPILRNVSRDEVESFRRQIQVVDMIGCEDAEKIENRVNELTAIAATSCGCGESCNDTAPAQISAAPIVKAQPAAKVEMDKAGYFVIIPRPEKGVILAEHYSYDNKLLRVIEGSDARSLYFTIIENGWVTQLSHAAYLGKELTRAEISLESGEKFVQDGA